MAKLAITLLCCEKNCTVTYSSLIDFDLDSLDKIGQLVCGVVDGSQEQKPTRDSVEGLLCFFRLCPASEIKQDGQESGVGGCLFW